MTIKVTGYNQTGEAIALHEGKVFYIPGLIIGEEAKVKIIQEDEKWGKAVIEEILVPSEQRVSDIPEDHLEIGGYELMHMNRDAQTDFKINKIKNDFLQNAKTEINLEKMFIGKNQLRYRNKITLHDGGFYRKGTHEVFKVKDFLLTSIKPSTNMKGDVIIRQLDSLISGHAGDKVFTTDTMLGIKFYIALNAFYQVNKEVAEAAYTEMLNFLDPSQVVFDLYSGIGTITLLAAKKSKKVYGVERNNASHKSALINKEKNKVHNVDFILSDVFKFLRTTDKKPDVVIVDPAREGLRKEACSKLLELAPKRIIYLSCNPGTQAADYNRLKEDYKITYAKPFDMFPQTYHIENLIILDRRK